jgi:colanic acid/amylovoran biosynthesis glycosyltransferase
MLVIVTPNPDTVADTFVRQHIQLIAPGKTAVAYFQGNGNNVNQLKTLKIERNPKKGFWGKVISGFNLLTDGYAGCLTSCEQTKFVQFLKDNHAGAVLAEQGQIACTVRSACKEAGVQFYPYFHGYDATAGARGILKRYSYWRLGLSAKKVFVGTAHFKDIVANIGVARDKIVVAPCGLMVEAFQPSRDRIPNLVVAVGRMVEKKAPHLTIKAFSKVVEKVPDARLEMIGEGPLLQLARDTANHLEISHKVTFHGAMAHDFVKHRVSKAMVFVQHSVTASNGDTESLGVSLLEAMACEVPVVTTRHNGFTETIDDGVTGFLVDEYDTESMAHFITKLLADAALRNNMGQAGRQRVKDYYESRAQARYLRAQMGILA